VHGANRLASNSLLEGLVFSNRAAEFFRRDGDAATRGTNCAGVPAFRPYHGRVRIAETDKIKYRLQNAMTRFVGIVRSDERLGQAEMALSVIADEVDTLYATCRPTEDLLELRNLYLTAQLIIRSAQQRKESRGLHYTTDYPEPVESERHDTLLRKRKRTDFTVLPAD
jgi:L-aspartate oxidase